VTIEEQPPHDPLSISDLFSLMSPLDKGEDDYPASQAPMYGPIDFSISPEDHDEEPMP